MVKVKGIKKTLLFKKPVIKRPYYKVTRIPCKKVMK
jgi:hypothetical protein